jgi:hypothetical protein
MKTPPSSADEPPRPATVAGRRVIFLHVPKTAGTSIMAHLRGLFPNVPTLDKDAYEKHGWNASEPTAILRDYRLIQAHDLTLPQALSIDPDAFLVFASRQPVRRVLSQFRYFRSMTERKLSTYPEAQAEKLREIAGLPLVEAVSHPEFGHFRNLSANILLGQWRYYDPSEWPELAPQIERALERLDALVVTEWSRLSLALLERTLDRDTSHRTIQVPRLNITGMNARVDPANWKPVEENEPSAAEVAAIEQLNWLDMRIHQRVMEHFHRRMTAMGLNETSLGNTSHVLVNPSRRRQAIGIDFSEPTDLRESIHG